MNINASIIIRSYNEERHIGRLIIGIQNQNVYNSQNVEIIVVDSGSTDSTVSIARQLGAKVIEIRKEEFSFGRALNIGCNSAKGDILIFVSAHIYPVYNDWLEVLINIFSDYDVGLVYGRQIGNDLTHFSEQQIFNKWFPEESNRNQSTPFCNNANCAIRKSLWLQQAYDEALTGLEDLDWAHKIMAKGCRIVYDADAAIVHVHEETPQKIKNRYRREAIALKHIMPKVHVGFLGFIRLFVSNTFSDFYHAIQKGCFWKEFKNILVFRFMQFYGTYLGHQQKGAITKELKNRFYYPNSLTKQQDASNLIEKKASKKIEYS
jgi:glycosyltransferase involved in cell wall biosynthesis